MLNKKCREIASYHISPPQRFLQIPNFSEKQDTICYWKIVKKLKHLCYIRKSVFNNARIGKIIEEEFCKEIYFIVKWKW